MTKPDIKTILEESQTVAVVGLSPKEERDSHRVAKYLQTQGYRIIPVNPNADEILGERSYPNLASVPEPIDVVDVFRRSEHLDTVVDQVLALTVQPKAIWGQLGVRNDAAAARAEAVGIRMVMNRSLVSEYPLVYEITHQPHGGGKHPARAA